MYVRTYVCRYENAIKLIDQLVNAYITIWKDVKVNKYWDVMWNTQNNILYVVPVGTYIQYILYLQSINDRVTFKHCQL